MAVAPVSISTGPAAGSKAPYADRRADLMRRIGPLLPEHRVGRENLRTAFPQKSAAEIEKILGGVWDNLGRIAVEFAHLD